MPTKRLPKNAAPDPVWISARQLCDRFGGVSHMWLERRLAKDPGFPRATKFGRLRFFRLSEVVAWERAAAAKSSHAA